MSKKIARGHTIERTSPKGGPFVGTCTLCGTPNLTDKNLNDECPNQRGLTEDEALLEAIEAPQTLTKYRAVEESGKIADQRLSTLKSLAKRKAAKAHLPRT